MIMLLHLPSTIFCRWFVFRGKCTNGWKFSRYSWRWDIVCWRPYLHWCQSIQSPFAMADSIDLSRTGRRG